MKLIAFFVLLCVPVFCLPLAGRAQAPYFPPVSGQAWDTVHPASLGWCQDGVDSMVARVGRTDARALLVLKNGRMVVEEYYGNFGRDSAWYWASAGKAMTAFLVGLAQEQGLLDIDDSTAKHLGAGWTSCAPADEGAITIRHQLTMTTGLDETFDGTNSSKCTDDSCLVCVAPPGTRWSYHNAPYTLLRDVVEAATGMGLNAYKNQQLLASCGIAGRYFSSGYDHVYWSTPRSMARFGLLVAGGGKWGSTTVMHDTAYLRAMINTSQPINPSYGYL